MARRNHMNNFTCERMIGKLEEGRTVTSVATSVAVSSESTKVSFHALGKCSKPQVLLERLVVAARGRQLQGMTDISSCRRKEANSSQQVPISATLYSNGVTSVAVYYGQMLSQREPIRPPSWTPPPVESWPPTPPFTVVKRAQKLDNRSVESCPFYG
ncbi:hypothetical protein TNCV_1749111 [Trichonephila clavipes]|nr:hypothetical protein TNCV_1749111 [Trichonephila clavipes]